MAEKETPRILLVDDSETLTGIAESVLKKAGHPIDVAVNGKEAMDKIDKGGYDLILLDIKMPGIDGFEVFRWVRSREETRLLPEIIFFSDYGELEADGLKLGASDFIAKSHVTDHPREFTARIEAQLKIAELTRTSIDVEKLRILKATVMSVEHEVRNPLLSIGLILDKIEHCPHCAVWVEKGRQSAARISEALDRLIKIDSPATRKFIGKDIIDTPEDDAGGKGE